jgi:hypothetical protein
MNWRARNKNYYIAKGYSFTNIGDEFRVDIKDISKGSHIQIDIECDGCGKELKNIPWKNYLKHVKNDGRYYCKKCSANLFGKEKCRKTKLKKSKSFEQWCIENNYKDILDRWDYELNDCKPNEIAYSVNKKKYYFKCPRGLHKSELKNLNNFTNKLHGMDCKACNSFAQWGIDNLDEDFLVKYWDYEKNTVDPWEISYGSDKTIIYIKCQIKNYHGSYKTFPSNFTIQNNRCSYCANRKIHPLDSLGTLYPEVLNIWSDKNKTSPYEYAPMSNKDVYWKCFEGIHKDYKRNISNSNIYNFRCPQCNQSKGEKQIEEWLIKNNIKYDFQKEFQSLIGLGGGLLSYDFYLPNYNLLIEYQGEFHDGNGNYYIKKNLKKQLEHDRRKREYAENNNINLLEIWYWDYDNIEDILKEKLLLKRKVING